ncbi:transposase (plasmid) [Thermus thermophilus]|nr:transposase [Thermus thermophilus]
MGAPIRIHLTPEEDAALLRVSQDPEAHPKTRRWALILRLAHQGWTAPRIAAFLGLDRSTVRLVLRRYLQGGLPGLPYRKPPGAPVKVTEEVKAFLREKLAEDRLWTLAGLQKEVEARFGLRLNLSTLSRHLRAMGYVWKRTRYVPAGKPEREEVERFRAVAPPEGGTHLRKQGEEEAKRGPGRRRGRWGIWTRRGSA